MSRSSHHCKAEERAGIAIKTHVKWRYQIITGRRHTHQRSAANKQPRKAHMSRGALWLVLDGEKHPPQAHHGGVCRALDA